MVERDSLPTRSEKTIQIALLISTLDVGRFLRVSGSAASSIRPKPPGSIRETSTALADKQATKSLAGSIRMRASPVYWSRPKIRSHPAD